MNLLHSKKAEKNLGKAVEAAVVGIVILVILFVAYSVIVPEAQTAGNALNSSNQCASAGCHFNVSNTINGSCAATSTTPNSTCADFAGNIPLAGLFSGTGVVFVIIMAVLIITIVKSYLKSKK